jgi:hypothetical protein
MHAAPSKFHPPCQFISGRKDTLQHRARNIWTKHPGDCISLLYMVCVFYSQFGANTVKAENEKILYLQAKARGIKPGKSPI